MKIKFKVSKNITLLKAEAAKLLLQINTTAGYKSAFIKLKPGRFDSTELDLTLNEYPSGKSVQSQGWDRHNIEKRMVVPTFTAFQQEWDLGDVWFDVPNYLDHRTGALEAEFGFYVEKSGEVQLRLIVIASDRKRFNWDMVESITVIPDDRNIAPLVPRKGLRLDQPWLFMNGRSLKELRADFRKVKAFRAPMKLMEEIINDYEGVAPENQYRIGKSASKIKKNPPAYLPIDQVTAGAALVTGSKVWIDLGRKTVRRLGLKPTWALDPKNKRLMGEENDMTIGHPLLSMSMLYQYLREHLDVDEKAMAVNKAREYARKLYEFSILQKRYATGVGHIASHESGPLLGLGVACMVFWDEIPETRRWLAWAHGRMMAGALAGPLDGRHSWLTYGAHFLAFYAAAVEDFSGKSMFNIPFLKNLPSALIRNALAVPSHIDSDFNLLYLMAEAATYQNNPQAAWAWHMIWKRQNQIRGTEHFIGWQDMLWHPRHEGSKPPASYQKSFLFEDTGCALMQTNGEKEALACFFQSGLAVGGTRFKERKRYGMEQHDASADGGLVILLNKKPILWPAPSQYRRGFAMQSAVTVNGDGHYMENRVLGTQLKQDWVSRMLSFSDTLQKTVAVGDNTGAYRKDLGVKCSRRRVLLDKKKSAIEVDDSIKLTKAQRVAVRFQSVNEIEKLAPGRFRFSSTDGEALEAVIAQHTKYKIQIGKTQMVLPYSYGFNFQKSKKRGKSIVPGLKAPNQCYLEIQWPEKTKKADFKVSFTPVSKNCS